MKLNESQLRSIIRESITSMLREMEEDGSEFLCLASPYIENVGNGEVRYKSNSENFADEEGYATMDGNDVDEMLYDAYLYDHDDEDYDDEEVRQWIETLTPEQIAYVLDEDENEEDPFE